MPYLDLETNVDPYASDSDEQNNADVVHETSFLEARLIAGNSGSEAKPPAPAVMPIAENPRQCAAGIVVTVVILVTALAATGGFAAGSAYTFNTHGTTTALARTTLMSNTSVDPCVSMYSYACGGYTYTHNQYSSLADFQRFINAKISTVLESSALQTTAGGRFFKRCVAYSDSGIASTYFDADALWVWQHGSEARNVSFGRTLNPWNRHKSSVYIANSSFFDSYRSSTMPSVLSNNGDACDKQILKMTQHVVKSTGVLNNNNQTYF